MHLEIGQIIVLVVAFGIAAQWFAWRLKLPAIVLLSVAGLIAGPITGFINPSEIFGEALQPIIALCVAIILFEGGLNLRKEELAEAGPVVRRVTSIGVLLSWGLGTLAAHYLARLDWGVAAVLGAIVTVTGPTVVIPLLRQASLKKRPANILKWEGIVNDPTGVLLAVITFQYLIYSGEDPAWQIALMHLGMAIGASIVLGGLLGWLLGKAYLKGLVPEYLKGPVLFAAVLLVFAGADSVQHEAGLLAVTIMGIVMGNMNLRSIMEMRRFKENLTILLVSVVFVLLTANLDPEVLLAFNGWHALFIVALLVLVRPLAIYLATLGVDIPVKEKLLVGWTAPRGVVAAATAGVFSTPLIAGGHEDAAFLVPIVFALIFITVVIHGFSLNWVAKKLDLVAQAKQGMLIVGASPATVDLAKLLKELGVEVCVSDTSWHRLRSARMQGNTTFFGEILSEHAEDKLELHQYATLLAATSNDAYNALVCKSFAPEMGAHKVYQLAAGYDDQSSPDRNTVQSIRRGVVAFDSQLTFEELWQRRARGWKLKKSKLSDDYSYEQLQQERPDEAIILLLVSADGGVVINNKSITLKPKNGDTIVMLRPPE